MKKFVMSAVMIAALALTAQAQDYALKFDGSEDYVNCGTMDLSGTALTMETWIRPHAFAESGDNWGISTLMGIDEGANGALIRLVENRTEFVIKVGGNEYKMLSDVQLSVNAWVHIACTYDGSAMRMYLNGEETNTNTSASGAFTSNAQFNISYSYAQGRELNGEFDEMRIWKSVRTQAQIQDNMWNELSLPQTGLEAYYQFNETSGTTLSDATGNHDGTLTNMSGSEWLPSTKAITPGNALDFDGWDDYVTVPASASLQDLTAFTYEAWVYPRAGDDDKFIGKTDQGSYTNGFLIGIKDWGLIAEIFSSSSSYAASSETAFSGWRWTHVAVSWQSGGDAVGYINGKEVFRFATFSGSIATDHGHDYVLGAGPVNYDNLRFDGLLDNVTVWTDVRTVEEIRSDMVSSLNGNEADLALYYNMNQLASSTVTDLTTNSNTGTLNNMDANSDWVVSESYSTWTGAVSSDWGTSDNWSLVGTPDAERNVYIPTATTYPSIGSIEARNLYLHADASLSLSGDISLFGDLTLQSNLDLNGYDLTLSTLSSLIEDGGVLTATTGSISSSRDLNTGMTASAYNMANLGFEITESSYNLGNTGIERIHTNENGAFGRYYTVNSTNNPANATIVFHYSDDDLNGYDENSLTLYVKNGAGYDTWADANGSVNTTDNTITCTGVTQLHETTWMLANESPAGAGTEENPYKISSKGDLIVLSNTSSDWDKYFLQTADIDFEGTALTPIGNVTTQFSGTYDGHNYKIYELGITHYEINSVSKGYGMFGSSIGTIRNLGLINCTFNKSANLGTDYIGPIAAVVNDGTVEECYCIKDNGILDDNSANSYTTYAAGLVGFLYVDAIIKNCYTNVTIKGGNPGGIVGYSYAGDIIKCYAAGEVIKTSNSIKIGGIIASNQYASISGCFYRNTEAGYTNFDGTASTTEALQTLSTFTDAGWDFDDIWDLSADYNEGYPNLEGVHDPLSISWNGTNSSDWDSKYNWDINIKPKTNDDVTVPNTSYNPVISSGVGAICNDLTVETGASLTVNAGGSLITNGIITNNGTIEVKQSIAKDASNGQWHFITMPNATTLAGDQFEGMYLQQWNEGANKWEDIVPTATPLDAVQGYSLWVENGTGTQDFTYTGTPNTGNQSMALSNSGTGENKWMNFVGNPYPSYLDWNQVIGYGSKYTWNGTAYEAYVSQTGYGTGSQYAAPMEAFFIYKDAGVVDNFSLTNAMRTHQPAGEKSGEKGLQNGLVLYTSNGSYNDDLWVVFDENATENFELERDAWKILSGTPGLSQLWSVSPDGLLAIDARPECGTIQLGFANDKAGSYSIGIREMAGISNPMLEDTKTGIFHDLNKGAYEFAWDITDDETRFKLHLNTVGIGETPVSESSILIYAANQQIFIKGASSGTLMISDVMGRVMLKQDISGEGTLTIPVNLQTGIYLATVQNGMEMKTEKVFIK